MRVFPSGTTQSWGQHFSWRCAKAEDIGPLSFDLSSTQQLVREQTPFLLIRTQISLRASQNLAELEEPKSWAHLFPLPAEGS